MKNKEKKSAKSKSEDLELELHAEEIPFDESDPALLAAQAAQAAEEFGILHEASPAVAELAVDEEAAVGSELEGFEAADVEDMIELTEDEITSVVESLLFATDKALSPAVMKSAFAGTKVRVGDIRKALQRLQVEYAGANRGVILEEVAGGFQLRTKPDNMKYLKQTVKGRPFKLSGPALEVLSIVAYKQPCVKNQVDEIRGVESGHLMRGLLERGIIRFAGKSDLPGRPMYYETTKKFLEIFGLRSLQELPSLNEIDQILPEGIDETEEKKETLGDLTGRLSEKVGSSYSEGEEELTKITEELSEIHTSSEFFEEEKRRQKAKADADKAQDIREKILVGEEVSVRDRNWLERYEQSLVAPTQPEEVTEASVEAPVETPVEVTPEAEV
jgi:segregation and condensation protein B